MKSYNTYLFDLDGTLIDTLDLIVKCFQYNLDRIAGIQVTRDQVLPNVGLPLREQYRVFLEPLDLSIDYQEVLDAHMDYQIQHWKNYIHEYPGAKDTLRGLKKRGAKLAIVTSRRQETANLYIQAFGFHNYIDVLCTPDKTLKHKPYPDPALWTLDQLDARPEQALFVGDSLFDVQCGNGAGCDTCYVSWGHRPVSEIAPVPTYVIDRLEELLSQTA